MRISRIWLWKIPQGRDASAKYLRRCSEFHLHRALNLGPTVSTLLDDDDDDDDDDKGKLRYPSL